MLIRALDGKTLNTCAGCFELNLDPEAAEIYCNSCKDMLLRRVAKEKNSRIEESSSWRTTGLVVEGRTLSNSPESESCC